MVLYEKNAMHRETERPRRSKTAKSGQNRPVHGRQPLVVPCIERVCRHPGVFVVVWKSSQKNNCMIPKFRNSLHFARERVKDQAQPRRTEGMLQLLLQEFSSTQHQLSM